MEPLDLNDSYNTEMVERAKASLTDEEYKEWVSVCNMCYPQKKETVTSSEWSDELGGFKVNYSGSFLFDLV